MKHTIFIMVLSTTLINCMDEQRGSETPESLAKKIEAILALATPTCIESVMLHIKTLLHDETFSLPFSQRVQEALTKILSEKVVERHYAYDPSADGVIKEIIHTRYYDGTYSLLQHNQYHPLDSFTSEILFPKPISPWYSLPFEDLIKRYICAQSANSKPDKFPLH